MVRRKKHRRLLVFLLFFLLCLRPIQCRSATSSEDEDAMFDLARSISGLPSSWKPGSDPCSWDGVTCSAGRVTAINLVSRGVSGSLPPSLASLSALTSLNLQHNRLSGPLPLLPNLSSLQSISLEDNDFDSIPDSFFAGLLGLQFITLDNLPLAPWNLTRDLVSAAGLSEFSAANASIYGPLPDFLGSLPSLRILRLSYNHLSGPLPRSFAGSGLQQLFLNSQQSPDKLSGRIDVMGAMPQLTVFWIQSNDFTGPIPDLSNLTSLESFNARDNALTGVVPVSLTASLTLKNVSLSNNVLQGSFPQFASKSVALDIDKGNQFCLPAPGPCDPRVTVLLDVAAGFGYPALLANSWEGDQPCGADWVGVTCDAQGNVIVLNFANQHFGGKISPAFSKLTSLRQLILSSNDLAGSIPRSLTQLPHLQLLDVTNNSLSGKVPTFGTSVRLKLDGNPKLGDDSGSGGGSSPFSGSTPSSSALIAGLIVASVVVIACSVGFYYRRGKQKEKSKHILTDTQSYKIGLNGLNNNSGSIVPISNNSLNQYSVEAQSMHISIQSLRTATDSFSKANILGSGGFGVVYKGNHNGTLIAVKRNGYDLMGNKGNEEFKAEIEVLRKVKHKNLVALVGFCNEDRERLLVYEYMAGGTLTERLFKWQDSGEPPLNWNQRLVIALDVARAIEYLHSFAQESYIHRDLKPSNILLDKDLRAKVSDFGLVKLAADNQKSMQTRLAGTFGYLAPEYATTGRVSTKVDVYAFGVILMELITGRKVLDESQDPEDIHLVAFFRRKFSQEKDKFLTEMMDQTLELDEEAKRSWAEVADLAWHSTTREPHQRPDMSHAVNRLAHLVDQWRPTHYVDEEDDDGEASMSLSERMERWRNHDTTSTTYTFDSILK
ncbi:receptor protein kinase WSS1-like [Curcuma longa]|uniref:receptor protein kinase WSS1-like n=1 Tax=Curcuma longa TaxID=136217 RepID=UPI003D9E3385